MHKHLIFDVWDRTVETKSLQESSEHIWNVICKQDGAYFIVKTYTSSIILISMIALFTAN